MHNDSSKTCNAVLEMLHLVMIASQASSPEMVLFVKTVLRDTFRQ
jgi:hypothetical protein